MYFILILFFGSLLGIIFMIGRKLAVLGNVQTQNIIERISGDTILEEWKDETVASIKRYSFVGLVIAVRLYVYTSNFLKKQYQNLKTRIESRFGKKVNKDGSEKAEASMFLKMISDYKRKIRRIRRQIKEEEEEEN